MEPGEKAQEAAIGHVSDTALWVAYYRALESERLDALFHDPWAKVLAGEKGQKIAESMKSTAKYTSWSLAIRTRVIDEYIQRLVAQGVDAILNLGAGLDTRPYRLRLPESLLWIEVDHPHVIDHKERVLAREKPSCRLERVRLDLAEREKRQAFFAETAARSKKALVLTEGVIPYLTEDQVSALADDVRAHDSFQFWIAEYFAKEVFPYLKSPKRMKQMRNAPFRFFPENWFGFFEKSGWIPREVKYLGEESEKLNRKIPAPWWVFIFRPFISKAVAKKHRGFMGYALFERS